MTELPFGYSKILGVMVSPAQRAFFQAGLGRGMSATGIINALKGTDLAIRRQVGLALTRELKGAERAGSRFDAVRMDYRIADTSHQTGTQAMRDAYSYWGRIDAVDPKTDQHTPLFVNFSTSKRLTRGEIVDSMTEVGSEARNAYGYRFERVNITAAYKRPEPPKQTKAA